MSVFERKLATNRLSLRRGQLQTLQVNVGRKCNQACRHCHVNAAPWRKEMMSAEVAHRVGDWIRAHRPPVVDITGGAPELSEHFCFLVETSREAGCRVLDRNNLTIIETAAFGWLPEYLADHEVEIVASLPCYLEDNVNAQRGDGVFEKSIAALRKLNAVDSDNKPGATMIISSPPLPKPCAASSWTVPGAARRAGMVEV
jgi:radical SAM/Cys-rich protein